MSRLSIESQRKATDEILEKMNPELTGNQLLKLNKVLNEEFNKVEFLIKDNTYDAGSISEKNQRLLKSFLDAKRVEGLSKRTLYKYEFDIQHLLDWMIVPLDECTTEDIREFLSMWKSKGNCSNVHIDGMRRVYSTFFRYLSDNGFIYKNPMIRIHKIRQRKLYKKAFNGRELELLRAAISNDDLRMKAIFELLLSSGMRVGELTNLKKQDLNFEEKTVIVTGKGDKQRECFFNDLAKVKIQRYLETRIDDNPYLFVSFNRPFHQLGITGVETRLRNLGEQAGVNKVHPHRFRRTFATRLLHKGVAIDQIQKFLGHVNIETTKLYAMSDNDEIEYNIKRYVN